MMRTRGATAALRSRRTRPARPARPALVALVAVLAPLALPAPVTAQAQPVSPLGPEVEYEGALAVGLAVRRLGNTLRVLHVGAHPDDENTALLTPLALGSGADVAYLSLTRGEGGQNSLGPELGVALGLIRSEELLAARRVDGAVQYFTRAIDFGFSKNATETFTHWPRDSVLADIVAVIRHFRPDIVIPAWTGSRRDGHGQHEAAGILAREAVVAAADSLRFPEQASAGLRPHRADGFYWSARYLDAEPDVEFDTGRLDPLLGRSYYQLAMASRSRHRSQDMGARQAPGPRHTAFVRVDPASPPALDPGGANGARDRSGPPSRERRPVDGGSIRLSDRASRAGLGPVQVDALRGYEGQIERATGRLGILETTAGAPMLLGSRANLRRWRASYARYLASLATPQPALLDLAFHVDREMEDLDRALVAAAGVQFDAVVDREVVSPGDTFVLELSAWHGGASPVVVSMRPVLPAGWTFEPSGTAAEAELAPGSRVSRTFRIRVPLNAGLTSPYFLSTDPGKGEAALYSWPAGRHVGVPFQPAAVRGQFSLNFPATMASSEAAEESPAGARLQIERSAAWIGVDSRSGEFRRPLRVIPVASIALEPRVAVLPRAPENDSLAAARPPVQSVPMRFVVRTREGFPGGVAKIAVPESWQARPSELALAPGGPAERVFAIDIDPAPDTPAGEYYVGAIVELESCGGRIPCAALVGLAHGFDVVDYPHVAPHHWYRPATARVRVVEAAVADVRVGYVAGVPDGVPEALDQLGVDWKALTDTDLAEADLGAFDVILTGTRAYEFRGELVAHNDRLLDWARAGGTLIVQYNKYPALRGSYAPWPVTIARPHGRVTDESAPVTVLVPDHPVFREPNRLDASDWEGWRQERGLYFWESWGGGLVPLVSMHDPGEAPLTGALLAGPLGEGTYVYSALALFRQLPEGVPGAHRLLANLVSLGAR